MNLKTVCKGCEKRYIGCHSSCNVYIDAKAEYEKKKDEVYRKKYRDAAMQDFAVHSQERRHGKDRGRIR